MADKQPVEPDDDRLPHLTVRSIFPLGSGAVTHPDSRPTFSAQPSLWHVARDQRGAAMVEHALMLALIVGVVIAGADMLGRTMNQALAQGLNSPTGTTSPSTQTAGGAAHGATTPSDNDAIATADRFRQLRPSALLAFVAIGGYLWAMLHRRRVTAAAPIDADEDVEVEAVENTRKCVFAKRQQILRVLSDNHSRWIASGLQIGDVMSPTVVTVRPNTSAEEVHQLMDEKQHRHLLVTDAENHLLGVISDRDLRCNKARFAADFMTPDPISIAPSAAVSPATTLMLQRRISCLPVVDGGVVVGVVTVTDLVMTLQCTLQILQQLTGSQRTDQPEWSPRALLHDDGDSTASAPAAVAGPA